MNSEDAAHLAAVELSQNSFGRVITTAWVLAEVGDALANPAQRPIFRKLVEALKSDRGVLIVKPSAALFDKGLELYFSRTDKEWSLTDCISFVLMDRYKLKEALTGDHHFKQAGFRILFNS